MDALPLITAEEIAELVPMRDAVAALRRAFATPADRLERLRASVGAGDLLVMAAVDDLDAAGSVAGVKVVVVRGSDRVASGPARQAPGPAITASGPAINGVYVLFDGDRGEPVALLDGAALTRLRTPAVSAIATDALARRDVGSLGVFGTGPQAHGHVEAVTLVRPGIVEVLVAARPGAAAFVAALRAAGFAAREAAVDEAAGADVVCTCTSSASPVLRSAAVRAGAHLNLIGSYRPERREVDADLVRRSVVVVDDLGAARAEAGDLVMAEHEGRWSFAQVRGDLVGICRGQVARHDDAEITLFKSVGLARQDLVIAALAARRAGVLGER